MSEERISKTVESEDTGSRLDAFLGAAFPNLSRRSARVLCQEGSVRLNGRVGRPGSRVRGGDEVSLSADLVEVRARPELVEQNRESAEAVQRIFEDEDLLVVAKPPLMSTVRLRGDDPLTLADCVAALCTECITASADPREAGLVQRLDYYTSGLLLAAKSREIWERLHSMLLSGDVQKNYTALVEGRLPKPEMEVFLPLRSTEGGRRMETVSEERSTESALLARTDFRELRVIEHREGTASIVEARGEGMRRHQVRVHLASCGCPLLGDELYGSTRSVARFGVKREGFLLQAETLALLHPRTGKPLEYVLSSKEFDSLRS